MASWEARLTSGRLTFSKTQLKLTVDRSSGLHLTTDLADNAIAYLRNLNAAAPNKPFFLYYVPGGSHSPHQPKKEWIEKFKGKFDMGWENCATRSSPIRSGWCHPSQRATDALAGRSAQVGLAHPGQKKLMPIRLRSTPLTPLIPTTRLAGSFRKCRTWANSTTR